MSKNQKKNRFTAPVDRLVHETTGYVNAQIDNVKLRSVKGLSEGTSAVAGLLVIFITVGALVTTLSFAIVLWLGELMGSYALAAFIMSGVLLLAIVVLVLLRKQLFKSSFISMYTDIFFQKESKPEGLKTMEGLDIAIWNAETRIKDKEEDISDAFTNCKEFYAPKNLLGAGVNKLSDWISTAISSLFGKKKK
jgi:hypothetical protein